MTNAMYEFESDVIRKGKLDRLRDDFAMAAMNGIQSNSAVEYNPKDMAERAYWIADEMLIARGIK